MIIANLNPNPQFNTWNISYAVIIVDLQLDQRTQIGPRVLQKKTDKRSSLLFNDMEMSGPVFCSLADQDFWICIDRTEQITTPTHRMILFCLFWCSVKPVIGF